MYWWLDFAREATKPPASPGVTAPLFFGLAAFLMKRLLVHHARPLPRRIARAESEALGSAVTGAQALEEVEHLLRRLAAIDPKLRLVVEMKAFEGLSRVEIGQRLGCSVRTVARHWDFAQRWLQEAVGPQAPWQ